VYYYLRDFVEALSQRWNTYVVGYDLRKQVRIFDAVTRGYESLRSRAGIDKGPLARITRAPVVAGAVLVLLAVGYVLWKRRQRTAHEPDAAAKTDAPGARVQTATALYRTLETALQAQGITRPPSTPPLRHAEELRSRAHPLAEVVASLTSVYLGSRFGGEVLSDASRRDFERHVREIRAHRPEPKAPSA
jgi:hypothetical protein